ALTPTQIRHAYGVDQITFAGVPGDGHGQTIAIIDAYDDPTIASDLQVFNQQYGIAPPPSFRKVAQDGSNNLPPKATSSHSTWAPEIALDVEWAHALAPGANLLLVEAASDSNADLYAAVDYAAGQPGVAVVSMSFGSYGEFVGETSLDGHF